MKQRPVFLWLTVSMLYVAGCLWLFFGTLNFGGLDLVMSRRDSQYQTDCWFTAARGFLVVQLPILCLWLEYRVTGRFGRLRIWWSRYCVSLLLAVFTAMYLWYRSHIPMTSPYPVDIITPYIAFTARTEQASRLSRCLCEDAESAVPELSWGWDITGSFNSAHSLCFRLSPTRPHKRINRWRRGSLRGDFNIMASFVKKQGGLS